MVSDSQRDLGTNNYLKLKYALQVSLKSQTTTNSCNKKNLSDAANLKEKKYREFSSVAQSCPTLCNPINRSTPGLPVHPGTNSQSPPKPMSIVSVMPSNHLILCCLLFLLPSIFPSIRVFSHESALHIRWPKYWSFSFNISPSNENPGLISFRMDWLDLLAVHGTLKSLLQHHSSKAS